MRRTHFLRASLLLLAIAPLFTSCVSESQMRLAVQDRDREIAVLRGEKVELQERIDLLSFEKQDLRTQIDSNANRPVAVQPASAPSSSYVTFPELDAAGVTYGSRGEHVVFSMPAEITFASGKATLTSTGQDAINKVAARLKSEFSKEARFYIEGHTDSDPIKKSSFDSNRALSIARAMAVLDHLVSQSKVADDRFVVVGHGQYQPLSTAATNEAKAKNRRVEVVVHKNGE